MKLFSPTNCSCSKNDEEAYLFDIAEDLFLSLISVPMFSSRSLTSDIDHFVRSLVLVFFLEMTLLNVKRGFVNNHQDVRKEDFHSSKLFIINSSWKTEISSSHVSIEDQMNSSSSF